MRDVDAQELPSTEGFSFTEFLAKPTDVRAWNIQVPHPQAQTRCAVSNVVVDASRLLLVASPLFLVRRTLSPGLLCRFVGVVYALKGGPFSIHFGGQRLGLREKRTMREM